MRSLFTLRHCGSSARLRNTHPSSGRRAQHAECAPPGTNSLDRSQPSARICLNQSSILHGQAAQSITCMPAAAAAQPHAQQSFRAQRPTRTHSSSGASKAGSASRCVLLHSLTEEQTSTATNAAGRPCKATCTTATMLPRAAVSQNGSLQQSCTRCSDTPYLGLAQNSHQGFPTDTPVASSSPKQRAAPQNTRQLLTTCLVCAVHSSDQLLQQRHRGPAWMHAFPGECR